MSGYLKRYELYNRDRDSNLIMGVKEYDSDGNTVREEYYDENGILAFVEIHNGEESWTEHYDEMVICYTRLSINTKTAIISDIASIYTMKMGS